jgi:hypothetical protein
LGRGKREERGILAQKFLHPKKAGRSGPASSEVMCWILASAAWLLPASAAATTGTLLTAASASTTRTSATRTLLTTAAPTATRALLATATSTATGFLLASAATLAAASAAAGFLLSLIVPTILLFVCHDQFSFRPASLLGRAIFNGKNRAVSMVSVTY